MKEKREETKEEITQEEAITVSEKVTQAPKIIAPEGWVPKTKLGKQVMEGKVSSINQVFMDGVKITEPEIVDVLLPNLESMVILIGGSSGKGGGIRRTQSKRTTRMHKSGRRFRVSVMTVTGNKNGYIGVGYASGPPGKYRDVYRKALNKAKLNIVPVSRGCGSWECNCATHHSIPFLVKGKSGSVRVELIPAPKGIGLSVSKEVRKLLRLAGITDVWCKSRGNTRARVNLIRATLSALNKLNKYRIRGHTSEKFGLKQGKVE